MNSAGKLLQNRYLIQKQIGAGGMGTVYVATDERFGSTVAIKETLFSDPNLRRAFEREAQLLNSLRHSALPRVSDHFTEGNGAFIVFANANENRGCNFTAWRRCFRIIF